jgi:hypothetical protein
MIFTSDLMNPEGPVFLADGSLLVVEGTRGTVTQIMPGGSPPASLRPPESRTAWPWIGMARSGSPTSGRPR